LSYFARLAWKPEYGAGIASTAACLQNNGANSKPGAVAQGYPRLGPNMARQVL